MDRYEIKKKLWNVAYVRRELKNKIDFYNDLKRDLTPNDYTLSGMPKGKKVSDPVFSVVSLLDWYDEQIGKLKFQIQQSIAEFDSIIAPLDSLERHIFVVRYLHGIRWDYIEQHVNYSRRQAVNIHNRGINKILKTLH